MKRRDERPTFNIERPMLNERLDSRLEVER